MSVRALRCLSTSSRRLAKKIQESVEGNVVTVSLVDVPKEEDSVVYYKDVMHKCFRGNREKQLQLLSCSCCLCHLPARLHYTDVLILEQFMRDDGSILPAEFTGVCIEQQEILERCVMQAHWAGLFPDKTIAGFDRSGWKRLNRHWKNDLSMLEPEVKLLEGTFYYNKRYNPKVAELADVGKKQFKNYRRSK